jgi:hypothetical protein
VRFRDRHFVSHSVGQHERVAGGSDGLVSLLSVLRLLRIRTSLVGQEVLAVTLRDHRTGSLQRGVGQRGAVGTHVGDVALLVETLRRPHRHRGGQAKLVARLLLESGGDEWCGRTATVRLRLAGPHLIRHTLKIVDQRSSPGLVEHHNIVTRESTVVTEIATARKTGSVDLGKRGAEFSAVTVGGCELALHIPITSGEKRHTFAFSFDHKPSANTLDTARRQLRHDLLPEHRRHFVAVEPIENSTGLLRIDHLAVEFARLVDRGLNRLLGDLVEHHTLDRHLRVQDLNEMPSNRLALAILIRCEVQLVGFLQE